MREGRLITKRMADQIFQRYNELKPEKITGKQAFEIIQAEIKRDYDEDIPMGTIEGYARKGFYGVKKESKLHYEKRRQNRIEKRREMNPSYAEYLESFLRFDRGENAREVGPNNEYVNILKTINETEFPAETRGDRLAKKTGLIDVTKYLVILSRNGLIEHDTKKTFKSTRKGKDFLNALKSGKKQII